MSKYAAWTIRYRPQLQIWISREHIALLFATLFQLEPLQPSQPATWAAGTQKSHSHRMFMNAEMLYESSAKQASFKSAKASRAKGGKQRRCHHPWARVGSFHQTNRKRSTRPVKEATTCYPRKCHFFAVKEARHRSEVRTMKRPLWRNLSFYLDEKEL